MKEMLLTFGEVMGRFEPSMHYGRFAQSIPGSLNCTFAGAEANVAADYSLLGGEARFVTALPSSPLTTAFMTLMRGLEVDVSKILLSKKGRFGLFFLESGSNQRASKVYYDREGSAISIASPSDFDFDAVFKDVDRLHISGITPAISRNAAELSTYIVAEAKKRGVRVSVDLNYRGKLWNWEQGTSPRDLARKTMGAIVENADIIIGNEEDAFDVLGIKAGDTDVNSGKLDINRYPEVARLIASKYPNVEKVAFTLRQSISASHNNWGAMLWVKSEDKSYFAPVSDEKYIPYQITDIVDRVGGGDSFAASLLYALQDDELGKDYNSAISFAVAASCLCHTIKGDFNYISKEEAISLMKGNASGRVKR